MSAAPLVFITGASSGIGQALAEHYARAGWRLALSARRVGEIEAWAAARGLARDRCVAYAADVQRTDSIVGAGRQCIAEQGLPDVVIANAGISVGMDTTLREDIDVMADTLAINNVGLAATFHPFLAPMRGHAGGRGQRGGHPRPARPRRLLRQQGRCGGLLRKPARRMPR